MEIAYEIGYLKKQFYESIETECITLGKMIGALIKKRKAIEEDRE